MNCENKCTRRFLLVIAALGTAWAQPVRADYESEFLLFPYIRASFLSGLSDDSRRDDEEVDFALDLFAAIENRRFIFLGEALLAKDEQAIERLQVGWRIGENKLWLGRFHNPIGYWNTQFHHGAYVQTSISRPAIVEYEHDFGVLPMHLTGLLLEGISEHNNRGLGYEIAIAAGPEFTDELEALDLFSLGSDSEGLTLAVNVYRQPVVYGPNRYGLFANYSEIPAQDGGLEEIHQLVAGGYWNWETEPWRLIGSTYVVRNRLNLASEKPEDDFLAGYVQAERWLNDRWTIFGRIEKTFSSRNDVYLALFPDHLREKILGGLRVNILNRHALTLEVSSNRRQDDRFRQFMLQWAAIY